MELLSRVNPSTRKSDLSGKYGPLGSQQDKDDSSDDEEAIEFLRLEALK